MSIVRAVSLRDAKSLGKNGVARLLRLALSSAHSSALPPVWGKRKAIKKKCSCTNPVSFWVCIYATWCVKKLFMFFPLNFAKRFVECVSSMLCVRSNIHSNTAEETAGILLQTPLKKRFPRKMKRECDFLGELSVSASVGFSPTSP